MAASLRTAAARAARALGPRAASQQQQGPLAVAVRCMSGEYNPFTHALDRLNTKKVCRIDDGVESAVLWLGRGWRAWVDAAD